jgi:hypothetical protein
MASASVHYTLVHGELVQGPLPPGLALLRTDEPPQGDFTPLFDVLRASLAVDSQGKNYLADLEGAVKGDGRPCILGLSSCVCTTAQRAA